MLLCTQQQSGLTPSVHTHTHTHTRSRTNSYHTREFPHPSICNRQPNHSTSDSNLRHNPLARPRCMCVQLREGEGGGRPPTGITNIVQQQKIRRQVHPLVWWRIHAVHTQQWASNKHKKCESILREWARRVRKRVEMAGTYPIVGSTGASSTVGENERVWW